VKFTNAPLPLEETGKTVDGKQVAFKDISGGELPVSPSGPHLTAASLLLHLHF
jgi:hypothetical protein